MLFRCIKTCTLMVCLSITAAQARPIVLNGNANGVWSTSHPEFLPDVPARPPVQARALENSPVFTKPEPEPEPVVEVETVCPTLLSAPHLCQ